MIYVTLDKTKTKVFFMARTALVTGSAGFIGYFTSKALLTQGWNVVGLDAMTDYYDVELILLPAVVMISGVSQCTRCGDCRTRRACHLKVLAKGRRSDDACFCLRSDVSGTRLGADGAADRGRGPVA